MKKFIQNTALASLLLATSALAEPIVEQPWLRNHLPAPTSAYARIPHPLFVFTEADTPLQPLYQTKGYQQQVTQVTQSLMQAADEHLSLNARGSQTFSLVFEHVKAPIELAVPDEISLNKQPTLLLATKLDYPTTETLEKALAPLLTASPFQLSPADGDTGRIEQKRGKRPMGTYYYQPKSGKLLVVIGNDVDAYQKLLNATSNEHSPIFQAEQRIDNSGQGLLAVVKPSAALLNSLPLRGDDKKLFQQLKLDEVKEVALGFGVSDQQPQVKAYIDMPNIGLRQMLPSYGLPQNAVYYGQLSYAVTLSLPNVDNAAALVSLLGMKTDEYDSFKQEFKEEIGVDFDEVLSAFGRAFTYVSDDNGSYLVTDADFGVKLQALVNQLKAKDIPLNLSQKEVAGKTLYHLDTLELMQKLNGIGGKAFNLSALFSNNHYYWIEEGDSVILSDIPQPLLARNGENTHPLTEVYTADKASTPLPFFSVVVNSRNLSQRAYYQHLRLLNRFSDVAGVPFAISDYPTANALNFKRYGAMGLRVDNEADTLSVALTAENGLMDGAALATHSSVVLLGVLAAIAIPAYQDYVMRARLY